MTALDDHPVAGVDALHQLLTADRIDRAATLTLLRQTEKVEVQVTPREIPAAA